MEETNTVPENVPLWQKDEDANECFLCGSLYTFFNRRHHCRRCGRVVCGNCSAHDIKYLPNTYVVSPPSTHFLESPLIPHRTCTDCFEEMEMIRGALEENGSTNNSVENLAHVNVPVVDTNRIKDVSNRVDVTTRTVEDDDDKYCPICGKNLLKVADEVTREQHINDCLFSNEFSGSPDQRRNNRMLVYNIPIPEPKMESINEVLNAGSLDTIVSSSSSFGIGSVPSTSVARQEEYSAVDDEDGANPNECVICLEEFSPGDKVGRLECLCVFHYKCIKDWFERKGPGECPVHAVHQ